MDNQKLKQINQTIEQAKLLDVATGALASHLDQRLTSLHQTIQLPQGHEVDALKGFITRYIDRVPVFMEAIENIAHEAGIDRYANVCLDVAADYFLSPPDVLEHQSGLEALMDEAYLAHRLFEEVNDRFIGYCGIPLAPMDMTRANILMHSIIGESFANELDEAVHFSVELLAIKNNDFQSRKFRDFVSQHRNRGWSEELAKWPCLTEELDIDFDFSSQTVVSNLH